MTKLAPPAPQHPGRRHQFFKDHPEWPHAKDEIGKLEAKYKNLRSPIIRTPTVKMKEKKSGKEILFELIYFILWVLFITVFPMILYMLLTSYGIGKD